jgi:hypothetical protein
MKNARTAAAIIIALLIGAPHAGITATQPGSASAQVPSRPDKSDPGRKPPVARGKKGAAAKKSVAAKTNNDLWRAFKSGLPSEVKIDNYYDVKISIRSGGLDTVKDCVVFDLKFEGPSYIVSHGARVFLSVNPQVIQTAHQEGQDQVSGFGADLVPALKNKYYNPDKGRCELSDRSFDFCDRKMAYYHGFARTKGVTTGGDSTTLDIDNLLWSDDQRMCILISSIAEQEQPADCSMGMMRYLIGFINQLF